MFLKVYVKNLVKVSRIGEVMGEKENTYFKGTAIKMILSKHVVLIMRIIIHITINMDDIKQVMPSESPILNLIKRLE